VKGTADPNLKNELIDTMKLIEEEQIKLSNIQRVQA